MTVTVPCLGHSAKAIVLWQQGASRGMLKSLLLKPFPTGSVVSDSSSMPKRPGGTSRRPTIRDVAADAKVSKTSVSRYFGAERERLSPELKEKAGAPSA